MSTAKKIETQTQRRKVPRRPIKNRVGLLIHGQYHISWAFDLGEGGMLISSPVPLQDGDVVVITLRIPDVLSGVMTARVVYGLKRDLGPEEARYGIKFEEIDFELKRKIRNYVASSTTYVISQGAPDLEPSGENKK